MGKKREIRVEIKGEQESAKEFVDVYKRAVKGKSPRGAIDRIYFADMETLTRVLSNRRLELLQTLHRYGSLSIRALAKRIDRDYKNVYGDVQVLKRAGLIEIDQSGCLLTPWDRITAEISLAA
ncbi:MAG TPA: hypothetical protein VI387_11100 [Candidatus Brocadiales bacterium]|nr:hypothetical protein [Candidatus Brocadiales bacterium]